MREQMGECVSEKCGQREDERTSDDGGDSLSSGECGEEAKARYEFRVGVKRGMGMMAISCMQGRL